LTLLIVVAIFGIGILLLPLLIVYVLILIPAALIEGIKIRRQLKEARLCGSTDPTTPFTR
jgi:hypothetical protein